MTAEDIVELVIEPRLRDIGDFAVRRILPYARRRMVGPFIFLDEFGPVELPAGRGIDVQSFNGSLLHEPWDIQNKQQQPFKVFTAFWRAFEALAVLLLVELELLQRFLHLLHVHVLQGFLQQAIDTDFDIWP